MRRLIRVTAALAVLGGMAWLGLQFLLGSGYATGKVSARLQSLLGVPVKISSVEVGVDGSAALGISIAERESTANQPPFLTIDRAETDLGLSELISGSTLPGQLTLRDAQLILRYDREGRPLTKLPQPTDAGDLIPEVRLERARVTIQREGQPDCHFEGIELIVRTKGRSFTLAGTANDPNWGGKWQAEATIALDGGPRGRLHLQSTGVHVKQEALERLPYISQKIWDHVKLEGDTPVDLHMTLGRPGEKASYRLAMSPTNTAVYVPSIDLHAAQARGQIVVENEMVFLKEIHGQVADGELHIKNAELDFRPTNGNVQHYALDANRLNLRRLPTSWRLPPRLGGRLSGQADIRVDVVNGHAIPSGSGEGRVDGASLGPIPIPNYGLRIQADAEGFRFEPRIGR